MEFYRGDTYKFKFQRLDANNEVITSKADKMWFTVKANYNTENILIQKTLENKGITFDSDSFYHVTIEPEDTSNLAYKTYVWGIQVEHEGVVKTIYSDTLEFKTEVTFGR